MKLCCVLRLRFSMFIYYTGNFETESSSAALTTFAKCQKHFSNYNANSFCKLIGNRKTNAKNENKLKIRPNPKTNELMQCSNAADTKK